MTRFIEHYHREKSIAGKQCEGVSVVRLGMTQVAALFMIKPFTFCLVTASLVHKLVLRTNIAPPREKLGGLTLNNEVPAVCLVVRTRVALLIIDMVLFKVLLVGRAQVLVMNSPAPV
jgi:hypothetical protein